MLEQYYVRPSTVDRIRSSWIAPAIEQYVSWLAEHNYRERSILRRIPLVATFGEFAKLRCYKVARLAYQVEPFVDAWVTET